MNKTFKFFDYWAFKCVFGVVSIWESNNREIAVTITMSKLSRGVLITYKFSYIDNTVFWLYCKSIFFQKGCFHVDGFPFYKMNIHFFCIFLYYLSKHFLLKLKLFKCNSYYNKNLLRNSPQNWQKRGYSLLRKYPFWNKFAFTI